MKDKRIDPVFWAMHPACNIARHRSLAQQLLILGVVFSKVAPFRYKLDCNIPSNNNYKHHINGNCRILNHIRPYFVGIFPYIGLIYIGTLHFRILKFPLTISPYFRVLTHRSMRGKTGPRITNTHTHTSAAFSLHGLHGVSPRSGELGNHPRKLSPTENMFPEPSTYRIYT